MSRETCNLGVTCTHSSLDLDACLDYVFICHGFPCYNGAVKHDGEAVEPSQWRRMDFCAVIPFTNSPVTRDFSAFPSHLFLLIYTHQKPECNSHCFQSIH